TGGIIYGSTTNGAKDLDTSVGPLRRRMLETAPVVSSNVALLGDAAPGDIKEAVLSMDLKFNSASDVGYNTFANDSTERAMFLVEGELLGEAFNDGPAFSDSGTAVRLIRGSSPLKNQIEAEVAGMTINPTETNGLFLQDTRDWY